MCSMQEIISFLNFPNHFFRFSFTSGPFSLPLSYLLQPSHCSLFCYFKLFSLFPKTSCVLLTPLHVMWQSVTAKNPILQHRVVVQGGNVWWPKTLSYNIIMILRHAWYCATCWYHFFFFQSSSHIFESQLLLLLHLSTFANNQLQFVLFIYFILFII